MQHSYTLIVHHRWAEIKLMHGKLMNKHYNIAIINVGQKNNNIIIYRLKMTALQIKFSHSFKFNYKIIYFKIAAETRKNSLSIF